MATAAQLKKATASGAAWAAENREEWWSGLTFEQLRDGALALAPGIDREHATRGLDHDADDEEVAAWWKGVEENWPS